MSRVLTVAKKELGAWFQSATALIFLGVFLLVTLFTFFDYSGFFARNIADIRPLFEWLPLLLVFLVAAITMRQWAEERRSGTLEVLMTLPIKSSELVIGKFVAGVALVSLALALTLPLPITVSMLGQLDWGPVVGGYLGALLLASAYLAIGLCVSSRTDNQVVALMITLVVGGLLYLVGTARVAGWFGSPVSDILRGLGSGSRFSSIARGVIDLRDLVYYASVAVFFLVLNVWFLETGRLDPTSKGGQQTRRRLSLTLALAGANLLALNVWLAPIHTARADLTENRVYSISDATRGVLDKLNAPLVIRGYFSKRTHPLLAPLVPRVKDLLDEYAVYGSDKVDLKFVDPSTDPDTEQDINDRYGIKSTPFMVSDRNSQSVINSYFHVLVRYGDKYKVLTFQDLVSIQSNGPGGVDVKLGNVEFEVTRAIKKVTQEFQSPEAILAALPKGSKLSFYVSPSNLPEQWADVPDIVRTVATKLAEDSGGRLTFEEADPLSDRALQERLAKEGIKPMAADLFGRRLFYLNVVLQADEQTEYVMPRGGMSEADVREALIAAVRRATPGQLTTVGLFTAKPEQPKPNPRLPPQFQPQPKPADYRALEQSLEKDHKVKRVDLEDGTVPDDVDTLIVAKPGKLTDKQRFAIDQYLMRGGAVIALASAYTVEADRSGLHAKKQDPSLGDLLAHYGVTVGSQMVMDPQNAPFPIPVEERHGPLSIRRIEMVPYPFFADIRPDAFDPGNPVLSGLPNVTMPWASPLSVEPPEGVKAQVLLTTSKGSWLSKDGKIEPDFNKYPQKGFAPDGETAPRTVAVTLTGTFPSAFADKPSPLLMADAADESAGGDQPDRTGRTIKQSLPGARLVVVGSADVASDLLAAIAHDRIGEVHRADIQFVENLVDWSVEDTDLLGIRSAGGIARTLRPLTPSQAQTWEAANYGIVLMCLLGVAVVPRRRRRTRRPLQGRTSTTPEAA